MASKDFANIAAAVSAGYKETVTDRGASFSPASRRYLVVLDKWLVGETPGASGYRNEGSGEGSSQANAETVALASINNSRAHRYGFDTAVSAGAKGGTHTTDVT
jgi:hypothetical protein